MILERHWDKWVPEPNTGCYIWTGTATGGAYRDRPMVNVNGKMKKVARLVCEEEYGPLGELEAAHKSRVNCCGSLCVNGDHLYPATRKQNCLDVSPKIRSEMGRAGGNAHKKDTK